mgnify:FL=1
MKKWMNWILIVSIITILLSGITIVFALNGETQASDDQAGIHADVYQEAKPYKVHAGDSLWKLTSGYSGDMSRQELIFAIMDYNEIEDPADLQINHVIYLPAFLLQTD